MEARAEFVLDVEGMTCDACAEHVREALEHVPGVVAVQVPGWESRRARVVASGPVQPEVLVRAVQEAGYRAAVRERRVLDLEERGAGPAEAVDLLVVGGGSAGFAAAIRGAELGARVVLVERGTVGGTCVNVGCIPSKALIRAVEAYHQASLHRFQGISTTAGNLRWHQVVRHKDELVTELRREKYTDVLEAYPGIRYISGQARLRADGTVQVDGTLFRPHRIVLATGARPWAPPIPGLEESGYLTSNEAVNLKELPRSLVVIGASAVGLELAQTYLRAGTHVTVLEALPRVVPLEEPEVGEALRRYLEDEGMVVRPGVRISRVERVGGRYRVTFTEGEREEVVEAEQLLVATGRRPNTAGLGLEEAGVELGPKGEVRVNEYAQTTNPSVYAAGDCTGDPMFVYVAAHMGTVAAENALNGNHRPLDLEALPRVTFTDPQVASAGWTEAQARERGFEVKTAVLGLEHLARARVARDLRGLIKLVADRSTDRLLGASVLAAEAGEVIQTAVLAIREGYTVQRLSRLVFPYLTLVEGLKLTAQAFEKDPARLSCCAG
ncbi:MAG: mercury(II) reductase [Armatimonadota bacterium]|nr:mercury(II) reductase [Armatimonadota bacterium]MDR7443972.1 mercury(II) reductase [Armatimonadota bacterium]MDR7570070.1 mercury(II) reductase [Armatimonadota bacterium]MDR7615425.1 mercury(II) reductase [Armatimonadota bacterium]